MIFGDARRLGEDVEQVGDGRDHLAVLGDGSCPARGRSGAAAASRGSPAPARRRGGSRRASGRSSRARPSGRNCATGAAAEQLAHQLRAPGARHQLALRLRRACGAFLISAITSSTLDSATARPSSTWPRSRALRSSNTVRRVTTSRRWREERLEQLLQVQQARLAVDQRHHVHAEGVLQLRHLVQVVQHHLGDLAALELDHHAHAGLVGLVAQVGDALEALLAAPARRSSRAAPSCSPGRAARR